MGLYRLLCLESIIVVIPDLLLQKDSYKSEIKSVGLHQTEHTIHTLGEKKHSQEGLKTIIMAEQLWAGVAWIVKLAVLQNCCQA